MSLNESIFFFHVLIVFIFSFLFLRMGKYALVSFIALQGFLANFLVLKQIDLFTMTVTATDVFSVGSLFCFNLLQEYFGKTIAKKAIFISFGLLFFATLMGQIHLLYTPASYDTVHGVYAKILSLQPRIALSSLGAFLCSQFLDVQIFSFLKNRFSHWSFSIRSFCSLCVSQLVDTGLFTFLALYSVVQNPIQIFIVSYGVKMIVIAFNSLFSRWSSYFNPKEAT